MANQGPYINGYDSDIAFTTNDSTHEAEDAGAAAYTSVTDCDGITLPKLSVAKVDTSHLKSPNRTKTRRPGWKDPGDAGLVMKATKNQEASLYALVGVEKGWRVTLADGSTFKFNGFIMDHDFQIEKEDDNPVVFVIAVSGLPVFAAAA